MMKKSLSLLLAGSLLAGMVAPVQAAKQYSSFEAAQQKVTDTGYILFFYPAGWDKYGEKLCKKLREVFDDATITTDILVGFPTETEEDFATTIDFAKRIRFEKAHVFPYSVRKGTRAENMPQLTKAIKEERASRLIAITEEVRKEKLNSYIGKDVSVLFEILKDGYAEGYTENYTPVRVYTTKDYRGEILNVSIKSVEGDICIAEII